VQFKLFVQSNLLLQLPPYAYKHVDEGYGGLTSQTVFGIDAQSLSIKHLIELVLST